MAVVMTEELVQKVANLARLEISPQEASLFAHQLKTILGYVDQLKNLDLNAIEPMTRPFDPPTPLREDEVSEFKRDAEGKSEILSHAPDILCDGFKVPSVI